jgi:hypothetical protein
MLEFGILMFEHTIFEISAEAHPGITKAITITAIANAGFEPVEDQRGKKDLSGNVHHYFKQD